MSVTNPQLTHLNLEIVIGCNLDCPMCIGGKYRREHGLQLLSVEKLNYILDKIPTLKTVNIIGVGEPLLHPQWIEIMNILADHKLGLTFTTNTTLLNEENIKAIHSNAYVAMSIDTLNPEAYKEIRGVELKDTLKRAALLRKLRPRSKLFINAVVLKQTIDDLNLFIPYMKKNRISLHLIHPMTYTQEGYTRFVPTKEHIKERLGKFKRKLFQNKLEHVRLEDSPRQRLCADPFFAITVKVDGTVFSCCYMSTLDYSNEYFNNHVIHPPRDQYALGNIFTDSIDDLFQGERLNHIRKMILSTIIKDRNNYDELRRNTNLENEYEYCSICLNRWGMVC